MPDDESVQNKRDTPKQNLKRENQTRFSPDTPTHLKDNAERGVFNATF